MAFTCVNLADVVARHGDPAEADALFARAIDIFETLGDTWGIAQATARLGHAARARGQSDVARALYEEARDLYRRIADGRSEARMLVGLGDLADEAGDASAAESLYRGALTLRHGLGDRVGTAAALERLAGVAADRPDRAATLIGASMALRDAIGAPLSSGARGELDRFLASLEGAKGREAVEAALHAGRSMTPAQAVDLALS
jgi:tetratricopeptide (TPR) repeat protein